MFILLQQSIAYFRKIHSNALPFEHMVLSSNENYEQKLLYDQTFIIMGMT